MFPPFQLNPRNFEIELTKNNYFNRYSLQNFTPFLKIFRNLGHFERHLEKHFRQTVISMTRA